MTAAQTLQRRPLRLLSWNVYNENPDSARIRACLDAIAPDVALLQEVAPGHLDAIRARYARVEVARDYILKGVPCHLAIATGLEVSEVSVMAHFPDGKPAASPLGRVLGWVEFLDSLAADIRPFPASDTPLRLVVLHTSAAAGPSRRREELTLAAAQIPVRGPCVVAGDFNSFAEPWLAPVLALPLAYRLCDLAWRERRRLAQWFADRGFQPAVEGVTFPRFGLQMDQVFLRGLPTTAAWIAQETWGSDHRPIVVDLEVNDRAQGVGC